MADTLGANPIILSVRTQGRRPELVATATKTARAAGVMTRLPGLWANTPSALASGLGLNAFVALHLIRGRNLPSQVAMGVVLIGGPS